MVRGVTGDHLVALPLALGPEVLAGELPRRLHGLGSAAREEDPVEVAGREVGEAGRELDRGDVAVAPDREVLEGLGLPGCGGGELVAAVPDLHGEQTRERVEVLAAVGVPDPAALRRAPRSGSRTASRAG